MPPAGTVSSTSSATKSGPAEREHRRGGVVAERAEHPDAGVEQEAAGAARDDGVGICPRPEGRLTREAPERTLGLRPVGVDRAQPVRLSVGRDPAILDIDEPVLVRERDRPLEPHAGAEHLAAELLGRPRRVGAGAAKDALGLDHDDAARALVERQRRLHAVIALRRRGALAVEQVQRHVGRGVRGAAVDLERVAVVLLFRADPRTQRPDGLLQCAAGDRVSDRSARPGGPSARCSSSGRRGRLRAPSSSISYGLKYVTATSGPANGSTSLPLYLFGTARSVHSLRGNAL